MAKRLKVLISAYACEPGKGSEPNVGWQWAQQIARFHDVTVITRANNQTVIEAALAGSDGPQPKFIYCDLPQWFLDWKRRGMSVVLYYILWQLAIRWRMRKKLKEFDLIHHITFNTFMLPGFWWFCGKPVVLGPLGGGQIFPWRFLRLLKGKVTAEIFRSLHTMTGRINPYLYFRFYFASRILVANPDTLRRIPRFYRHKVLQLLETGVTPDQFQETKTAPGGAGLRLIAIGRLTKTKGMELTLRAFAQAWQQEHAVRLTIIGDGPDAARLRALAGSLGVEQAVDWRGWLAHAEIQRALTEHDALIFTSLRDTSGNVILEAMASSLPVITLAHQGAAAITTDETARRVPVTTIEKTIEGLAEAIVSLARSPELRRQLGKAGYRRARETFSWDAKGDFMNAVYQCILPDPDRARLKVLLSAYACEPNKGSEPGVGWHWALQMARFHDVTVITRNNNQASVESALAIHNGPQPKFIYYDPPPSVIRWKKTWLPIPIYYLLWQATLHWQMRYRLPSFDLIHHVTFNSYRWPGFWWFPHKPVVLGPLGGGQICPWKMLPLFGPAMFREFMRSFDVLCSPINPRHYLTFHFATQIPVANKDTFRRIPAPFRHKTLRMLETGIDPKQFANVKPPGSATGRRFLWIGSLERRKALPLALRALALARREDNQLELTVVGKGPQESRLRRLADRLGLANAVHWAGPVPHAQVAGLLAGHDVFIFTSLRDTSGNVVLEAMASSLPVITLCHQGVAEITTDETALRVPPTNVRETTRGLAGAMLTLARDPGLRERLGQAGRQRVMESYTWDAKAAEMHQVYLCAFRQHQEALVKRAPARA